MWLLEALNYICDSFALDRAELDNQESPQYGVKTIFESFSQFLSALNRPLSLSHLVLSYLQILYFIHCGISSIHGAHIQCYKHLFIEKQYAKEGRRAGRMNSFPSLSFCLYCNSFLESK